MYDAGKIIPGIIIFIGLVSIPVWFNAGTGKTGYRPDFTEELAKLEGQVCVHTAEYMRANHMFVLNEWRDRVARDGERYITDPEFVAKMGDDWELSLTNSCMKCHSDKGAFCDKCHDYLGVSPYCWDCHLTPEVIATWPSIEDDS